MLRHSWTSWLMIKAALLGTNSVSVKARRLTNSITSRPIEAQRCTVNKVILSLSLSVSLPLMASEGQTRQDYKCLVETTRASQEIIRVSWDPSKAELYQRQMPGMVLERIGNREQRHYIREVFECVSRNEEFYSATGRKIDRAGKNLD
ncbi:TapY2 family type IVa secretion system protein [Shewanella algae]|uniref:TapY2 family type IVa secretion system protein n=2 Tax=Shewanella algae TaxID=38313 RepID=UPI0030B98A41